MIAFITISDDRSGAKEEIVFAVKGIENSEDSANFLDELGISINMLLFEGIAQLRPEVFDSIDAAEKIKDENLESKCPKCKSDTAFGWHFCTGEK